MIVSKDDFIGRYEVPIPYDGGVKIDQYIQYYEAKYLKNLFGLELYLEFISDPEDEKFAPLFALDLPTALKSVIYGNIKTQDLKLASSVGDVNPQVEGGTLNMGDTIIYNEGINIFKDLAEYCENYYPNYKGQEFLLSLW
jgi:hypothetical protein